MADQYLSGARGPSLVEHLEQENLITTETLNFGEFTFEILTLKNDVLKEMIVNIPDRLQMSQHVIT